VDRLSSRQAARSSYRRTVWCRAIVVPRDELHAATLKYAKRLAIIAPEAPEATKLAINRGADAGGFRNALQAGLDVVAPLYAATPEVGGQFEEIGSRDGLKAALKWRHAQFEAE
jgi:hypothetical protein